MNPYIGAPQNPLYFSLFPPFPLNSPYILRSSELLSSYYQDTFLMPMFYSLLPAFLYIKKGNPDGFPFFQSKYLK